jgi:PAS domain S-box-containing protein
MEIFTKILIAEHDPSDLEMLQAELSKGDIKYTAKVVATEADYINALEVFVPDIILSDYVFPSFTGYRAFKIKERVCPATPFIVVSGTIGEENSIELIKTGVTDFVLKDKLFTLNTKVSRALKDAKLREEKNKAEKELILSEAHLAEAQQLAKMGSWDFDIGTGRLTWSKELYNVFGINNKKNIETYDAYVNLVDEEDRLLVQQTSKLTQVTGEPFVVEYHVTTPDGERRVIREQGYGKEDREGKVTNLFGTAQEISESKKWEAAVLKAYEEKNAVLESIDDGFFAADKHSLVTYWNKRAEILLDAKKEDILGKNLHEVFADSSSEIFYTNYQKAASEKSTVHFEGFSKRTNKWFAVSAFGSENGLSVYFRDITEKKEYEFKLTKAIIKTQEDERYEIGGELHDNVCQILVGSLLSLGMIKDTLPASKMEFLNQCREYISLALAEIRNLSHRLAPAFFNEETLQEAFARLIDVFNIEKRIKISLHIDDAIITSIVSLEIQLNLYRILQEQLKNILKYAKATVIEVNVALDHNILKMTISDNGVGFDVDSPKNGIGFANMRRRAELFSGKFDVNSSFGEGCIVLVDIPLQLN